jgi:hypothetical protein
MKTPTVIITVAALLTFTMSQAQQSPSPQPVQSQAQTAPCVATASSPKAAQNSNSGSGYLAKVQKKYDDNAKKLGIPTAKELAAYMKATEPPCPPKPASTPAPATAPQQAPVKLPPDTSVTLHCNPLTPPAQGGGRQTTLTLPDPKDFAVPKANDFLMDSVVPDTAAKTPCYLIKVDPKTGKSFVQQ